MKIFKFIPIFPILIIIIGVAILIFYKSPEENLVKNESVATSTPIKNIPKKNELVNFYPDRVVQGEPLLIEINKATSSIKSVQFDGFLLKVLPYKEKSFSLIGFDVHRPIGKHSVLVEFTDGTSVSKFVELYEREKIERTFDIPEKLGGNTYESKKMLIASLAEENKDLQNIFSESAILWSTSFTSPLKIMAVDDPFGYARRTGEFLMYHKGVDLTAKEGTPVYSINDGVVRKVVDSRNYGKAVVIDHGATIMSFYLHLSSISVKEGDKIKKGDELGLSGQSGYAEGPHLHFSIRIANVSVDPLTFISVLNSL